MKYSRIFLIVIILIVLFFSYGYEKSLMVSTISSQSVTSNLLANLTSFITSGACSFKNTTGYNLCCMTGNTAKDCTSRTTFTCGEEVGFLETIYIDGKHGFYCFKQDLFSNKTVFFNCNDYSSLGISGVRLDSVSFIPVGRSDITFSEVYAFPKGISYQTNGAFLQNIANADKILSAKANVTCE